MKNTRVSAGRCTRAELARYFTITAKSIKANRNSAAQRSSIARTCGCADILDATRSSCEVIRAPLRPRSTLSPASGNTPRVTRVIYLFISSRNGRLRESHFAVHCCATSESALASYVLLELPPLHYFFLLMSLSNGLALGPTIALINSLYLIWCSRIIKFDIRYWFLYHTIMHEIRK